MDDTPRQPNLVAHAVARAFFSTKTDPDSIRRAVRRRLLAIPWVIVIIPLVFYLRFREVGPLGWGLSVFFVVYCLLSAIGLHFLVRPEYHTSVEFKNDWLDRIGAFWLVACAFGPLFGWVLTSVFSLTVNNWRWLYVGRVALCVGLPVLTSLALLRYVRGHGAPLMLALLIGVTALPIWSGWATLLDLRSGPAMDGMRERLPHTDRALRR